jgi:aryl-alcohol dehydrogenase-like predicted oxidoreductase
MCAYSRRRFLQSSLAAGAVIGAASLPLPAQSETANSLTTLGNTGLKVTRLAFGCPPGRDTIKQEQFTTLVRHAYDRGIRFFETAEIYHPAPALLANALHGLPRESYVLMSKVETDGADNPKKHLDELRRVSRTEYFDAMLLHFMHFPNWDTETEIWQEALLLEQEKKNIHHHGVSVHGLPALRLIPGNQWAEIAMVRINHLGQSMDSEDWETPNGGPDNVPKVVSHIHQIRSHGIGVIGMKLIGAGSLTGREDRAAAFKFAFQQGRVDCVSVGFKNTAEIDEAIENVNAALA